MKTITNWNPLRTLVEFPSSLSGPFEGFESALGGSEGWNPAVDISEDEESFQISAELPEVEKEDINISVDQGYLTISGERHHESEEENPEKTYHLIERKHGSYRRRFSIPDHVDPDRIAAKFDNGVLEITLPKTEKSENSASKEIKVA